MRLYDKVPLMGRNFMEQKGRGRPNLTDTFESMDIRPTEDGKVPGFQGEEVWAGVLAEFQEQMRIRGYTITDLALQTGLPRGGISRYFNGLAFPSVPAMIRMMVALGLVIVPDQHANFPLPQDSIGFRRSLDFYNRRQKMEAALKADQDTNPLVETTT